MKQRKMVDENIPYHVAMLDECTGELYEVEVKDRLCGMLLAQHEEPNTWVTWQIEYIGNHTLVLEQRDDRGHLCVVAISPKRSLAKKLVMQNFKILMEEISNER